MAFTLQDAEEMYTKAMHDAEKGDSSAQLFVKHCDPFDFVDNNDGKTDDDGKADDDGDNAELPQTGAKALYEAFKTTGNMKAALREMTGVVSDENQRMTAFLARFKLDEDFTLKTEELGLSFVPMKELKGAYTHLSIRNGELGLWNDTKFADIRYYDDEKELAKVLKGLIKPIVPKVKADDAFRTDPDKNKFMFLTTVYPRVHPTEEIATALVLKWTKQYSDDSEMRPVITKANEFLNKKDYIGALDVIHNAEAPCSLLASWQRVPKVVDNGKTDDIMNDVEALKEVLDHDIDYAEMHREEKALKKVKQRGRKKQREKNRRLRENREKELREKKRLLHKKMAENNEKKKQSKRERKRFSPMSKDMRMLHESIKDGFALK